MKKYLPMLVLSAIISISASAQWIEQATGFAVSRVIIQIVIVDTSTVWATAQDFLGTSIRDFTRTNNGGATWIPGTVEEAPNDNAWSGLSAISADTAWALFYKNAGDFLGGGVWKTTDGGETWNQQTSAFGSNSFPNVVHFWNGNEGLTMGDPVNDEFEIYTTNDGGDTWNLVNGSDIPDPLPGEFGYIRSFAVHGNILWFGTNAGRIYMTTDFGETWTVLSTGSSDGISTVEFANEMVGWVELIDPQTFAFKSIMRTTDGGASWTDITPSGTYFNGNLAYVPGTGNTLVSSGIDDASGFVFGSAYSLDGGDSWVTIDSNVTHLAVEFYNNSTGWSGGVNVDSTTGGIFEWGGTFIATGVQTIYTSNFAYKLYPNPSDGLFYISFDTKNSLPVNITVTDAFGNNVFKNTYQDKSQLWLRSIDLRNRSKGVYFISIENNGYKEIQKLSIQ